MKKIKELIFIIYTLIAGCSANDVLVNKMILRNGRYFISNDTHVPYTGTALSKFDTGKLSEKTSFINGVPNGKWLAYGYNGEVIQSGTYKPRLLKSLDIETIKQIIRINICTTIEGNQNFIVLYLVSNNGEEFDIEKKAPLFNIILEKLKQQGITIRNDLVDKIRIVKTEI
jgi:hypothetical protein